MGEQNADTETEMAVPKRVILLACGSFNPITNMHLRMFGKYCFIFEHFSAFVHGY